MYNEVLIDAKFMREQLPGSIEAFIGKNDHDERLYRRFLEQYDLLPADVALVKLNTRWCKMRVRSVGRAACIQVPHACCCVSAGRAALMNIVMAYVVVVHITTARIAMAFMIMVWAR